MKRPAHHALPALLTLLALLCANTVWADEGVVTLQHRPAEEILPLLTPFLEENEHAAGSGERLILSAPSERLHHLASIARGLDRPPRLLTLTLRRGPPPTAGSRVHRVGGGEERRITLQEGETVELFDGIRELEVRKAYDGHHGRGVELAPRERGRRLRARAWLIGDGVVVELKLREERPAIRGSALREVESRLSGEPGQWLAVEGGDGDDGRRVRTTRGRDGLWLKVE